MSKMEKILQNWNTADEYLNSKVEESRKSLEERIIALESMSGLGGDLEWFFIDTNNQAIQIENIDNCHFPVVSSYMRETDYTTAVTGGVLGVYGASSSSPNKFVRIKGTVRDVDTDSAVPVSGQPTVFRFTANAKLIIGIPKPYIEQFGVSIVSI